MDLWYRSTAADTKNEPFFVSHKGYRIRWEAPKTGYQSTLKTIFVVMYGREFVLVGLNLILEPSLFLAILVHFE
jgi:hypothetical protein